MFAYGQTAIFGYRGFTYDKLNQLCYFSTLQCGAAGDVCVTDDSGQYDHYDMLVGRAWALLGWGGGRHYDGRHLRG